MRRRSAFTLVELLVVISIIALLVAILLPSLRRARNQAKQVTCGTHLHQISLAFDMYAEGANDWLPAWSGRHRWGFYGTDDDGQLGDDEGPAWSERLRDEGSLPGIDIYRCPAFPYEVKVTYFESAYSNWIRAEERSVRRGLIAHPGEYITAGDCTNPYFYAAPFGTAPTTLDYNDSDMDDATYRGLDWDHPIHDRLNNALFADSHVAAFAKFVPGEMTHDIKRRGVDWGELDPDDPDAEPDPDAP
ncbi:MAG: type II secretion system protein [Phycisphaerales bacterium]|nr:type II secretion system protein [Phycisphaerales bacterium]